MKNDDEPEKLSEEAERLIEILDIPTPQALIDIEDLLSPLQKQTYEENNSLTQNDRNDAETATEKDIQFELGNLDKEFDNSATPESTIRVRHPDDSPTTPESMVSRRQNVPGGWGDQYQDYVPDRYQNNAPRRLNPEVGSQENVIEGHRRRHRANYSDHNHLSTNMTYYSTFLAAISQPETTKLFGELPKVRLYRDQLPPPPKRYRDVATHPFANEFQKAMNVEFDNFDTQPFSPSPPPPPLSPRQALVAAPQAPNFEATLRESRAEETIIPPPEGSEHATVAASGAASEAVDEGFSRYPKHCKPPTSLSNRASWVYSHGYRIALRSNVAKVTWICHYCYKHKFTTVGRGIHNVSQSPSAPARHLGEDKKVHGLKPPSKRTTVAPRKETLLERALQKGCSQAVANELTNFNIQEFRLAAVTWLVENNLPLSQFESSSFRNMIQLASVEAERALWASHNSVSRYVIRLYNYLLPKVVASLSESMSKVHISFDGWTTKGGKRGYLGIVAHYVDSSGELRDLPIALPQLTGAHTGEAMAEVVMAIFKQFEITVGKLGYFVLDNAHNNNTTINTLALQMGFSATERRLRCGPHTLNLIGQMLLWGEEKESYDNEETERVNEAENMATWRGDGPLGVLLAVINYIKTPQQYALFEKYQKLAIRDQPVNAPTEQHKIKEPVKPVVTRWNSYVSCFERAVELQLAVNGYANYHIQKIETEDAYARSRNNKLPAAPDWMRSDGINAHDWQVIAEYIDVLRPLKQATKRLEGRGKSGAFGAIAEVILVFEYLLGVYEDRLQSYEDVIYDEHTESPEDHLAINLRAALVKAREYYNKLDLSPAYYAAIILHPRYKSYLDAAWADKPDWLESSNRKFQHLWAEYKSLPKPRLRPKVRHNDIDDAINSFIEPAGLTENEEDEYEAWKRSEPIASEGVDPIKYWVGLRDRYPSLSKFAIDMLSIPGSSCECERLFSELGDLLEPRRRSISPQLLAAIQCDRRWIRAGFGSGEVPVKEAISDEEMDAKYGVHKWDIS
ncbi:Dimer-Tnp-hAT domain-containing protein [Pyrenophora tritici-repentis]|nr:Dimer-Tnp-hAT domain-containing protein [Pyrenophora tritici-repentis]